MEADRNSTAAFVGLTIMFFGGFVFLMGQYFLQTSETGLWLFGIASAFVLFCSIFSGGMATLFALRHIADIVVDARRCEFPKAANDG